MSLADRLREARRKAVGAVWVLGPWAVALPFLVAAGLVRRLRGAPPPALPERNEPAVSPYRLAAPPTWAEEPALPPELPPAPLPDAPYVPLPGPPTRVQK